MTKAAEQKAKCELHNIFNLYSQPEFYLSHIFSTILYQRAQTQTRQFWLDLQATPAFSNAQGKQSFSTAKGLGYRENPIESGGGGVREIF